MFLDKAQHYHYHVSQRLQEAVISRLLKVDRAAMITKMALNEPVEEAITFTGRRIKMKHNKYGISLECIQFHFFQVTKELFSITIRMQTWVSPMGPSHQVVVNRN